MTVYAQVLGQTGMGALAPECRMLHAGDGIYHGEISVEMRDHPVLRALLRVAGFPPAMKAVPLRFEKGGRDGVEIWVRQMAGRRMKTVQWATRDGQLAERMGAMVAISRLVPVDGGLDLIDWRFRFLGVPVPGWIAPKVGASERPDQGRYRFDIAIRLPWGGAPVLRYHGWLNTVEFADEAR